jgi:hypothetical protein
MTAYLEPRARSRRAPDEEIGQAVKHQLQPPIIADLRIPHEARAKAQSYPVQFPSIEQLEAKYSVGDIIDFTAGGNARR